jgi:hypothetical protein
VDRDVIENNAAVADGNAIVPDNCLIRVACQTESLINAFPTFPLTEAVHFREPDRNNDVVPVRIESSFGAREGNERQPQERTLALGDTLVINGETTYLVAVARIGIKNSSHCTVAVYKGFHVNSVTMDISQHCSSTTFRSFIRHANRMAWLWAPESKSVLTWRRGAMNALIFTSIREVAQLPAISHHWTVDQLLVSAAVDS